MSALRSWSEIRLYIVVRNEQVQFWAPAAAASGVSLVMAYLNGVAIPQLLSLRTLIAKWVGTCCSVAANLALGPEAPMVRCPVCMHLNHSMGHAACIRFDVMKQNALKAPKTSALCRMRSDSGSFWCADTPGRSSGSCHHPRSLR